MTRISEDVSHPVCASAPTGTYFSTYPSSYLLFAFLHLRPLFHNRVPLSFSVLYPRIPPFVLPARLTRRFPARRSISPRRAYRRRLSTTRTRRSSSATDGGTLLTPLLSSSSRSFPSSLSLSHSFSHAFAACTTE